MRDYDALCNYLSQRKGQRIEMSFSEIEEIIGDKLPKSAYEYQAWWSNSTLRHTHSRAWLNAGFKTVDVNSNISKRIVVFE
ncbi:DUF7662 domain-containing protein [Oribacterium sp. NK2B42]|uniref:DUF7662 domain-containing protein n=1 Tax=Oribacterium sp. NK2B42 TaxID=689781 RepID=UPI00049223F6|nr:hypothetical protein [Oribacterium sp. NK2B42]